MHKEKSRGKTRQSGEIDQVVLHEVVLISLLCKVLFRVPCHDLISIMFLVVPTPQLNDVVAYKKRGQSKNISLYV